MLDALAEFAVARGQFGAARVELAPEFCDGSLGIGFRRFKHRGHSPAPASNRTSSET